MGRTLLGVDLDESPVGSLVKRLLTDEELEKLADGGRPGREDDGRDDVSDAGDESDGGDGHDETDVTETLSGSDVTFTDASDGDGESGTGANPDQEGDAEDSSGEEDGVRGDSDSDGGPTAGVGSGRDSATTGTGSVTGATTGGPTDVGVDDAPWVADQDEDGESTGRFGKYKPLVLKGGAVVLVLVVVGLLVWRYGGKVKAALPFVGGSGDEADGGTDTGGPDASERDAGVSPARRRAKVGVRDPTDADADRDAGRADEREEADVRAVGEDVDLGALVGLGALALIAALVRKFGEHPPHDPLVDDPEE